MEELETKTCGLFSILTQEMRLKNYSPKIIKAYKSCIRGFIRFISPRHPRKLGGEEIQSYFLYVHASKLGYINTPWCNHVVVMRQFKKYLHNDN